MAPEFGKSIHQLPLIPADDPQETSRPRTARYPVPVRRPPAPSAVARSPRLRDRLRQRGRQAPQTRQPHFQKRRDGEAAISSSWNRKTPRAWPLLLSQSFGFLPVTQSRNPETIKKYPCFLEK